MIAHNSLQERATMRLLTTHESPLQRRAHIMPLSIVRNDITAMQVDAIVNAANTELKMGGGVCGAIFNAAGASKMQAACSKLAPIRTGDAVATKGFSLPAKHVIHAAGPVYRDGKSGEEELLRACYVNSLDLAKDCGCESVAFPLISSGIYGYPKDLALSVATSAIGGWLSDNDNDMDVSLVMFDKAAFMLSQELHGVVQSFIDENYVDVREETRRSPPGADSTAFTQEESFAAFTAIEAPMPAQGFAIRESMPSLGVASQASFDYGKVRLDEPFSTTLLRLIDLKGRTDVEVYKRANIDRKLFSKIRTGKGYMPGKKTVVALAVALELSLPETRDLLERAGFALSRSVMFDVIVEFFITRRKYDIFEINNVLFEYDQPLLGG
jgi:O-acetyl-ADP-ribose deacetylase (regulator of RNase III)